MKEIQLTITARSPLAIGRKKPGSVSEAEDYIPGSVIRGAIASDLIQLAKQLEENDRLAGQPEENDDFHRLFLAENAAIFHNAYPARNILPATAVSSKTKPGFKVKGNGVFDTLMDRFCSQAYNFPYDPSCPTDKGRIEPFAGFYDVNGTQYESHSVSKRLLTRVGINRRRNTSEEEILYSLEVLNEMQDRDRPSIYYSSIAVEDDNLANLLAQLINTHQFRFGGATSRGLGKVETEAKIVDPQDNISAHIDRFNTTLQQRWRTWEIFGNSQQQLSRDRAYFTINLQSDAILVENWRRTTVISPQMLCEFAGVEDDSLQLQVAYSSYDYRSGWNSALGLMKDVELVTNKGSVYLFSTANLSPWYEGLKKLTLRGVGERTTEGFGQVKICDFFHLIFRENAA